MVISIGSATSLRLLTSFPTVKAAIAPLAWGGVCCAGVMQLMVMARFYGLVIKESQSRSVMFFAPSVSIAVTAVTGGAVGMPGEVMALSVWAGVGLMLFLFPVVVWRVLKSKDLAANPSIGLLPAPCGIVTLAWQAARKTSPTAAAFLGPPIVGDILFMLSVFGVGVTLYCSFHRAGALRSSWFSSPWAAFTFPAATNANAALTHAMLRPHPLLTVYALALCTLVIPLILAINIAHLRHLATVFELRSNPKKTNASKKTS